MKSIAKLRKGISLLITLSVITAMLALMGVMFNYISIAQKKAESKSAVIQANLLMKDLKDILDKQLGKRVSKEKLKIIYSTPLIIQSKDGALSLAADCKPLLDRINIAWLGLEDKEKYANRFNLAKNLFDQLSDQAELRDGEMLFVMIKEYLNGYSGYFNISSYIKRKKFTISQSDFYKILNRYRFEADDKNVYKIKWDQYFTFAPLNKDLDGLDFDFLSKDLITFLFDVDQNYVNENYSLGSMNEFLEGIGEEKDRYKWLFNSKLSTAMECTITYGFRENNYVIKFNYIDKRISSFEIQNI